MLALLGTTPCFLPDRVSLTTGTQAIPVTGVAAPGMESFDRLIPALMQKWQIPGGVVGVAKEGRLVLVHGYGWADRENQELYAPESRQRIASLSKPITAVAILKLYEENKLSLETTAFCKPRGASTDCILKYDLPPDVEVDERIYEITVRHLLQHTGGWDRTDRTGYPWNVRAAEALQAPLPPSCETVIRWNLEFKLDFTPGKKFAYTNLGYCIVGRIIAARSGQPYETFVRENILKPMGIAQMQHARSLLAQRAFGEVKYYDYPAASLCEPIPGLGLSGPVPCPYGGIYIEARDAQGGWMASAADYLRFISAVDGRRAPSFLKSETRQLMIARPDTYPTESGYYALGWSVVRLGGKSNWFHSGGQPGVATYAVHEEQTGEHLAWVAFFNSRPAEDAFFVELDRVLWQAIRQVREWPTHDLFEKYP
jgi:N-acyl-D-amino-acid deacylase